LSSLGDTGIRDVPVNVLAVYVVVAKQSLQDVASDVEVRGGPTKGMSQHVRMDVPKASLLREVRNKILDSSRADNLATGLAGRARE
jgi:hypothetical protein